jgi:hypothetical protein
MGWMNGWMDLMGIGGIFLFSLFWGGAMMAGSSPAPYIYVLMMKLHVKSLKSTALL